MILNVGQKANKVDERPAPLAGRWIRDWPLGRPFFKIVRPAGREIRDDVSDDESVLLRETVRKRCGEVAEARSES